MSDPPRGWSRETRPADSEPEPLPERATTRADASAAQGGRPLSALQNLARKFEILGELGRGGMGVVYRARDREAGREVAIKLLLATPSPTRLRRFEREGATAARLRHKGIVAVHSAGQVAGQPYLVCELVPDAQPFDEAICGLPLRERVRMFREVVDAIAYAHEEGVIHRDIKPANVIVAGDMSPRVTDFGLARHEGDDRLTRTGASLGTPTHMAPEQARGDRDRTGPPADVWSLGIMLHEVVCGSAPFSDESATPLEAYLKLQNQRPPTLRARGAQVSASLDELARRALERNPSKRFPDARALCQALDGALAEDLEGARPAPLGLLAAIVGVAALAFGVLSQTGSSPPIPTPTLASSAVATTPSAAPNRSPSVSAAELLAKIEVDSNSYRAAGLAFDWLAATPRGEGHEQIRAWFRTLDRPVRTLGLPTAARVAFLADGRLVASDRDGNGCLWNPGAEQEGPLPGFSSGCSSLATAPDRRSYALLGNLRIDAWVYPGGQKVPLPLKAGGISLAASGDLVVGDVAGLVEVIDPATGHKRASFQAHVSRIFVLRTLAKGGLLTASRRRIAPQENKDTLRVWSADYTLAWTPKIDRRVDSMSVDRADRYLVVKISGGLIARYDLEERSGPLYFQGEALRDAEIGVPLAHLGGVTSAQISPDGQFAYSTAWIRGRLDTGQLRFWDATNGKLLETRDRAGRYGESDISADGRWIAVVNAVKGEQRQVELWAGLPPR